MSSDVTELERLSARASMRERQQAVVAQLGLAALDGAEPDDLMREAVREVAEVLDADYCKLLKYRPEHGDLLLIAGTGWRDGAVGTTTVPAEQGSHAGYTLMVRGPVTVRDLAAEDRFTGSALLVEHGVVSGVSCAIARSENHFGVLGVYTKEPREFTDDDANFVVSVANLLSTALRAKEAEARIYDSEEQFRTMANSISQLAWMADTNGDVFWYNQRWYEYTGTTFDEVCGWGWQRVHHPDFLDKVVERVAHCFETGEEWEDTFPLRSRSGDYRWFLSRALPIRNQAGEVVRWFGTNTDVTHQLEQSRALRANEEKLRLAIETNEIGTFEFYLLEEHTQWDRMLREIWGLAEGEVETQERFWAGVHPDDVALVAQALEDATAPGGPGEYRATFRVVNARTGKLSWVEASGQTLFEDGHAARMVGLVIDITERKELEESLRQAIDELWQADTKKNEFLSILGHELRNPLASLNNGIELLELKPEAVDRVLGIMKHSVATMSRLLDDLLDLSRISQDIIELDIEPVDIGEVVEVAIAATQDLCERRHQRVKAEIERGLIADGDATRLEQVFSNLIGNAARYTPEGGRIEVRAIRAGPSIQVQVRDTGVGINDEHIEKIFEPFFQIRHGTSTSRGLGVGLALSRKLAELHGGAIRAHSEGRNLGATFVVELPARSTAAVRERGVVATAPDVRPGLKVVLIEDQEDLRQTMPVLLETLGCEIKAARTGEYGMQLVRTYGPEAVLVDIGLPDMSGHSVAEQLRAEGYGGLLIAVSGYGHQEARERSEIVGFDRHLAKPAKLEEIARALAGPGRTRDTVRP